MEKNHSREDNQFNQTQRTGGSKTEYALAATQVNEGRNRIKTRWEQRVRSQVAVAEGQTSVALMNSLDIFLDDLITALQWPTITSVNGSTHEGMSKTHGAQRAGFIGYFLPQLLLEFKILREIITDDLHSTGLLTFDVRAIVDRVFDSAISLAATEFASVQQVAIKAALEKAEVSNRDLEHFAAVAAHDLKSPLATISGLIDLLAEESTDRLGADSREYMNLMKQTAERMRTLVDRLLEYASLTEKNTPFQTIRIDNVIKSVLQNLHDSIEKTQAQITWGPLPAVRGEFDLLIQLFQNLIANSIKFHGLKPPLIHINAEPQDGMILFSLRDQGIGFDPKDKDTIFALYKKLRGEAEYQGAGIGLASCRKVVELHGGKIWADSHPGLGSTFYFTLPKPTKEAQTGGPVDFLANH